MHFRSHGAHALSVVLLHERHANRPSGESLEADNVPTSILKLGCMPGSNFLPDPMWQKILKRVIADR